MSNKGILMVALLRSYLRLLAEKVSYFLSFVMVHALRQIKKQSVRPKTLLLVRLDTMGDYVLFRNFLQPIREAYVGYEITLLCNVDFLEIVDACDQSCVDRVIPLDAHKFSLRQSLFYRLQMLYLLNQQTYEVVINPVFHRFSQRDDYLIGLINAPYKIGSKGFELVNQWYTTTATLGFYDRVYTTLLDATPEVLFAFERNKEFFSQLLQRPLTEVKYHLPLPSLPANSSFSPPTGSYGIFFLGARDLKRKWALVSWVVLAKKISAQFKIVLCGSKNEVLDAQQIMESVPEATNLVGKTTLVELLHVLSGARFIVSNETAIPHLSVALGVGPVFVISNGNTFGRFVPYPTHMDANHHVIYHPKVEALLQTPHGFGRCMEIYNHGMLDLQIPHPQFPQMVAEKMAKINPDWIKETCLKETDKLLIPE